jgi:hypothetical protein
VFRQPPANGHVPYANVRVSYIFGARKLCRNVRMEFFCGLAKEIYVAFEAMFMRPIQTLVIQWFLFKRE